MTEDISELPILLADVAEAAGLAAALRLAADFGGTEVYIPRPDRLGDDHKLVVALGREAAERISRALGGEAHEIPMLARKGAMIRRLLDRGLSGPEVARRAGVHQRTVRRHKNAKADDRQTDLF